ncbi:ribosomal protein S5 domain 2-like protein [Polychaeton citri CBS 116435]|uniref:Ribosomal RNA-processing protein 43 n=1 Tax=Polychaeton citri CBS 116435 TaxID=1314669 RepID=A0A9P4Q8G9_9PEZI|nr:ribosomal protein S5 domain 2-like protein [Polychaeton citri CBS 116435]
MANGMEATPMLLFSPAAFAKLTPVPFLQAHLKQPTPTRPNGRSAQAFRQPTVNTGSLTHSDGSAVVRVGNTAVVCGVRAEMLLASDIPKPPPTSAAPEHCIEELGLLVPNLELSTGCSPAHLPGNPPTSLAQSLSHRLKSLLHSSNILDINDLRIDYTEPATDPDVPDEEPKTVTKAYWTLYLDVLCIALDGNAFDAAWGAVVAALRNTLLPKAWWDVDHEGIVCSPLASEAHKLSLKDLPIPSTFAVFSTRSPLKQDEDAETWVLADPDGFEEAACKEFLTVAITQGRNGKGSILKLEKEGGRCIGATEIRQCAKLAEARWSEWEIALRGS